jgi:hypothetical protein
MTAMSAITCDVGDFSLPVLPLFLPVRSLFRFCGGDLKTPSNQGLERILRGKTA